MSFGTRVRTFCLESDEEQRSIKRIAGHWKERYVVVPPELAIPESVP